MFSWLKRLFSGSSASAPADPNLKTDPVIAFVLLKGQSFPFEKLAQPLSKLRPAGHKVTDIDAKDALVMCNVAGQVVALALMPAPVPASDIQGPSATSWMWPKGTSATSVKAHKTHILATAIGDGVSPQEARLILSQVLALLAKEPDVMGIYWPQAGIIHHPAVFADFASSKNAAELLPVNVWIDFRTGKNPDGSAVCFTQGLSAFGLMELEYPKSSMSPSDLRQWMQNIAQYTLDKGPVLLHGQTLGGTADEKIKIIHTKSQFGAEGNVIRLEE
jgi:hypothetical protein